VGLKPPDILPDPLIIDDEPPHIDPELEHPASIATPAINTAATNFFIRISVVESAGPHCKYEAHE